MIDIADIQKRVHTLDGVFQALTTRKKSLEEERNTLKADIEILTKVSAVLKHLLDVMVKDEITKMSGLVSYGLKTVFDDQDLKFIPQITKKNEKIHIELKTSNAGIEGSFGSFGGSVAVIESLLLRIICILKKDFAKLLLLDETLSSVGDVYIPSTSQLISEISKKLGLDVLLVTHQKGFQENADHVYRVKESAKGLQIEKIK